jgi:hypothetical protein
MAASISALAARRQYRKLTVLLPPPNPKKESVLEVGHLHTPVSVKMRKDAAIRFSAEARIVGSDASAPASGRGSVTSAWSSTTAVQSALPTRRSRLIPRFSLSLKGPGHAHGSGAARGGEPAAQPSASGRRPPSLFERLRVSFRPCTREPTKQIPVAAYGTLEGPPPGMAQSRPHRLEARFATALRIGH